MTTTARRAVSYDTDKLQADMACRGWLNTDLARSAGVSDMTVTRFMRGDHQTAKTAQKLARALGYTVRRYLIRSTEAA